MNRSTLFLDETKGKAGVEVGDFFFPDLEKFVASVVWARKTSSFEELSQQKRFRLKKHMTIIRQGKQAGKDRMTRGTLKEKLNNHDDCQFFFLCTFSFSSSFSWKFCGWDP